MSNNTNDAANGNDLVKKSSLYREFQAEREEILRHKWIESEKAGYAEADETGSQIESDQPVGVVAGCENAFNGATTLGFADMRNLSYEMMVPVDYWASGGYLFMPVRSYSVGMLMRLAFSISTALSPDILLMDEWLAVGDAGFVPKAEKRLLELVGSTGILVMASHSIGILERVCNRLIWLDAGSVREDGPVASVRANFLAAAAS